MAVKTSRILAQKTDADVLFPKASPLTWNGTEYAVYPMPDSLLMTLSDEFEKVSQVLMGLMRVGEQFTPADLMPYLPDIIKLLSPNASRIIASCLRMDVETVANEMPVAKKLEALTLIVKAEDLPLIIANFKSLTGLFSPPKATSVETAEMNPA